MWYIVTTPFILKKIYPDCIWDIPTKENILYLTFDDGPCPGVTPFVLDELKKYNAKATFFCLGKNVAEHPDIYKRILNEGHRTGNHTFNHVNGWQVSDKEYMHNITEASKYIDSDLFRPPYGRITRFQSNLLARQVLSPQRTTYKIIMWNVVSGDFDTTINADKCKKNIIQNARPGSIVVLHDSEKAYPRMKVALTATLNFFSEKGYSFQAIPL